MSNEKSILHEMLSEHYLLKHRELTCTNLLDHFKLIATNRFEWTNLPNGIESSHIEKFLYEHGQVAFYDDENLGFMCLPCSDGGNLNSYGDPINLKVTGINYNKTISKDNCVRIKANDLCKPLITYVNQYVYLIAEIERISYQNLRQQRFPYIVGANKNTELTLRKIFEQMEEGQEAIYVDEKLNMSSDPSITVLKTEAPFLLDKLRTEKNEVKSELYTILGINNSTNEKRERLVVDEVNVNNGQILMSLEMEFKQRKKAEKLINEKYGFNIEVKKVIDKLGLNFLGTEKTISTKEGDPDGE